MAKRQRNQQVAVAFNYLVKSVPGERDGDERIEDGFTPAEFARVLARLENIDPLDDNDPVIVSAIKAGRDMNFLRFEEIEPGLYFGDFEGAYYGQRFRNNVLGDVDPDSLNMRRFII